MVSKAKKGNVFVAKKDHLENQDHQELFKVKMDFTINQGHVDLKVKWEDRVFAETRFVDSIYFVIKNYKFFYI